MMKTSTLIFSLLLCLTLTKAQDSQVSLLDSWMKRSLDINININTLDSQDNQDNRPDGNQDLAEESRKALTVFVGKLVHFVTSGHFLVLFHFLVICLANLLHISYSSSSLVSVPLVGNVILTNNHRCISSLSWEFKIEGLTMFWVAYLWSFRTSWWSASPTSSRSASQH